MNLLLKCSAAAPLDAEAWNRMLDEGVGEEEEEVPLVLDIRKKYEWDIGHFKGSQQPAFRKFRLVK